MSPKKLIVFIFPILLSLPVLSQNEQESIDMDSFDYTHLQLPPLETLFENAQKTPAIEIYENQKKIQERLLKKEKRQWLNFISLKAGYAYGKTDNYGSISDVQTPIFYQYTGINQHYYNAGGNINIPLESLFDLKGKIKRQKLVVEGAELEREKAFLELKQNISTLYVDILSAISSLKIAGEAVAVAQAAYSLKEIEFQKGTASATDLVNIKRQQMEVNDIYQNTRSRLSSSILILEIISNTPIISPTAK